jgi:hypothetical protein
VKEKGKGKGEEKGKGKGKGKERTERTGETAVVRRRATWEERELHTTTTGKVGHDAASR